jgi:hypothetical protein
MIEDRDIFIRRNKHKTCELHNSLGSLKQGKETEQVVESDPELVC